ncbi:MAG: S-layer homology domain-containing protein [Oscillospiraceae bacterium]
MKKCKLVSMGLALALVFSTFSLSAFALKFNDVDNDPTVAWAKDSIVKMTDAGYIKGYEDGTFKPSRAVSKIEGLLLMARMLGVDEKAYTESVENAKVIYGDVVEKFNTTYVKELSFLLYNDVLNQNDLNTYASSATANTPLFRYQGAILMTKLLGAEKTVSASNVTDTGYADNADIPSTARAYVKYVKDENVMNGMGNDANGKPEFSPNTTLTRAQMATLLERQISKLDKSIISGTIASVDIDNNSFTIDTSKSEETIEVKNNTLVKLNGSASALKNLSEGADVTISYICGGARLVEAKSVEKTISLYGLIKQISESSKGKQVTLQDFEDKQSTGTYDISEDCKITKKGTKITLADLKTGDFIHCLVKNAKVVEIQTADKSFEATGSLVDVDYDDADHVYVTISEKGNDENSTYEVSVDGAPVTRNGVSSTYRELAAGDTIALRVNYGKITKLTASSASESLTGTIEEILISKTPSITISVKGKNQTYKVSSSAKFIVNDEDATIYDLRPGSAVTVTLDSSEIKKLTTTISAEETQGEISGEVVSINTNYNVITIKDDKGNEKSIYYNTKTTFLKKDGSATTAKGLVKGSNISITGSNKNGVFEATIVIVK